MSVVVYHVGRKRSKRKAIRGGSCKGKMKHYSINSALKHIGRLRRNKLILGWYTVYRCKFCTKEANSA